MQEEERLAHVLDSMMKNKSVIGLMGDSGWILMTSNGETYLPIWPNETLAMAWGEVESPNAKPKEIEKDEWLEAWLPGMAKNGTLVLVCPLLDEQDHTLLPAEQLILFNQESS